ncbi:MAG: hypothetical protein COA79_08500 [Planctomycetota bacterium]|nr:MAG: hypothetical protein COA79_08500 [Planctomycetota bacterium]
MPDSDIAKHDKNMATKNVEENNLTWKNGYEEPFLLIGFKWFKKDHLYRRLPVDNEGKIPESVNELANCTAGGQIRFQTDSKKIVVRVEISNTNGMVHMARTGLSGCDLYVGDPGKERFYDVTKYDSSKTNYEIVLFEDDVKELRSFVINFPLYKGVKKFEVGLVPESTIKKPLPFAQEGPIVVYGTSITQGGCASRPGMSHLNIISRNLNMEIVNLGFSGSGRGEPIMAELISEIEKPSMIILEYESNAGFEGTKNTLEKLLTILRDKFEKLPILICTKICYAKEINNAGLVKDRTGSLEWQKNIVKQRVDSGDENLYLLDGSTLIGPDDFEATVDGVHPTDLGFNLMAQGMIPKIKSILSL